jgi:threonylcarbamoyladenosine tRNA methylthiotransferase MtaB
MKYAVITFGCRVNQADSLGFEEELRAGGATAVPPDAADVVIVNTCSVTATADQGARQTIRRIARSKPSARIVVTGCYATRSAEEVGALPNVVRVIPNDDKPRLIPLLVAGADTRVRPYVIGVDPHLGSAGADPCVGPENATTAQRFAHGEGACGSAIEPGVAGRTAFTVRVQTGCAEACSYCIIPTTRGLPRSVKVADVLGEVERVAAAGFKEIALTGVHLGSYGRDLTPRSSLIDLLRAVATVRLKADTTYGTGSTVRLKADATYGALPNATYETVRSVRLQPDRDPDVRFRISSLEPMDCSREIVDLVAASGAFAPHFHLPLQHASDRVLRAMRRPYTIDYYAGLVHDIRTRMPNASIGSDVIVGYPGETDDDFERLARYLEGSPLTHIHVFPYSDRPGTAATAMRDKVHGAVVRERARGIREIGQRLTRAFRNAQVGTTHRALTLEDGTLAVTGNYLKVRIPPGRARNEWIEMTITGAGEPMVGEVVTGSRP